MSTSTIYDYAANFIAAMNPKRILELRARAADRERLESLIEKEKGVGLTPDEKDELDHFLVLERLIRLDRAYARRRLASQ